MLVEKKRLFFAFEVFAPWPSFFPKGRIIEEDQRHLTIAFLGNVPLSPLLLCLENFPRLPLLCGLSGFFSEATFLPSIKRPNVVAWRASWFYDVGNFLNFVIAFQNWLTKNDFPPFEKEHTFLPHVTIARAPQEFEKWTKEFYPIPLTLGSIHLYESLGGSKYRSIWSYPLRPPFEEIEHDADLAFLIYGENLIQIFFHALTALGFRCPELINYRKQNIEVDSLLGIVNLLNEIIFKMDAKVGCPFKAVSFHGDIERQQNGLLKWEMIIDV